MSAWRRSWATARPRSRSRDAGEAPSPPKAAARALRCIVAPRWGRESGRRGGRAWRRHPPGHRAFVLLSARPPRGTRPAGAGLLGGRRRNGSGVTESQNAARGADVRATAAPGGRSPEGAARRRRRGQGAEGLGEPQRLHTGGEPPRQVGPVGPPHPPGAVGRPRDRVPVDEPRVSHPRSPPPAPAPSFGGTDAGRRRWASPAQRRPRHARASPPPPWRRAGRPGGILPGCPRRGMTIRHAVLRVPSCERRG